MVHRKPSTDKQKTASDFVNYINGKINGKTSMPVSSGGDAILEKIKQLSELHSSGILTDEEFSNKKEELLDRL
jgi:hypothetical protein